MEEIEQGERLREWLRQNGTTILTGIVAGIALIFGFNWWQDRQVQLGFAAGSEYQRLVLAADQGQSDVARAHGDVILRDHAGSPYAVLAALRLASLHNQAGEPAEAVVLLQRARGKNSDPALDDLLGLREARIHHALGDHERALALLDGVGREYAPMAKELKGDVLLALGRESEALAAYREAFEALEPGEPARGLLEFKLANLGETVDAPEA